ncbi:putative mitogen-activated protein kinase kinase kinase 1 [Iris pallida]|uniref:mitogen-activated protein kinase kinase kinase n=1 Tax=Iris pallida TaxID=29817 RepID=A0AAX6E325_IRIPA|nr:putative mitogen-activated protein kinase kinase kinase 1 [Iris pallida]
MKSRPSARGPRLDRRNAAKNIDYDHLLSAAASFAHARSDDDDEEEDGGALRPTRSLDLHLPRPLLPPSPDAYSSRTSFRVGGGVEGELDLICRSLGLSGPEDFAVPSSIWEAAAARRLPTTSRLSPPQHQHPPPPPPPPPEPSPSISLPVLERFGSTLDSARSEEEGCGEEEEEEEVEEEVRVRLPEEETSEDVASTSNEGDGDVDVSSSATTEAMLVISPNGRFRRNINSWMKGQLLGSGSFGTVYEGISHDGIFFAVKEVSLLDQGSNAQQCILQLEQEIALLSQFEHENIVQYYGTDKEEARLFIFIELVTQGSLASLYQKYRLRDSQVSAYTRQILKGLYYLHERNVVHRDIKCGNILVHANGSVKLVDFGLAKEITKLNMLKSCKGSVYWMAPEVVNPRKTYGSSADIWSLGCTVLEMLTRQIPYPNLEWQHAFFRIGRGEQPPIPNSLSRDARDFISQCVQVNPEDRPSAALLLGHPFVRDGTS